MSGAAVVVVARRLITSTATTATTTTMGFTKQVLRAGNGQKPSVGQTVTVHCTGYGKHRDLTQTFWSTKDPGQQVRCIALRCVECVLPLL